MLFAPHRMDAMFPVRRVSYPHVAELEGCVDVKDTTILLFTAEHFNILHLLVAVDEGYIGITPLDHRPNKRVRVSLGLLIIVTRWWWL